MSSGRTAEGSGCRAHCTAGSGHVPGDRRSGSGPLPVWDEETICVGRRPSRGGGLRGPGGLGTVNPRPRVRHRTAVGGRGAEGHLNLVATRGLPISPLRLSCWSLSRAEAASLRSFERARAHSLRPLSRAVPAAGATHGLPHTASSAGTCRLPDAAGAPGVGRSKRAVQRRRL